MVYEGYYHTYANMSSARMWNNYRSVRILVHEDLLDNLSRLSSTSPSFIRNACNNQTRQSNIVLSEMSAGICASVPFHLSHIGRESSKSISTAPAVSGLFLLWPLYVATCTSRAPDKLQSWVVSKLQDIGHNMGIAQATSLAELVKNRQQVLSSEPEKEQGHNDDWGDPFQPGASDNASERHKRAEGVSWATYLEGRGRLANAIVTLPS